MVEVFFMMYTDLQSLLSGSSSARAYFLSLPVPLQMQLHRQNDAICSAAALRKRAAETEVLMKKGIIPPL